MPRNSKCVIPHCGHMQSKDRNCILSRFPKDPERCRKWVGVAGVADLVHLSVNQLNEIRRVCGCHFEGNQFTDVSRKRLKFTAIPSIFDPRVIPLDDELLQKFPPTDIIKISTIARRININDNCPDSLPIKWNKFNNIRGKQTVQINQNNHGENTGLVRQKNEDKTLEKNKVETIIEVDVHTTSTTRGIEHSHVSDEGAGPSRRKYECRTIEKNEITMEGQSAAGDGSVIQVEVHMAEEQMNRGTQNSEQISTTPTTRGIKRSRVLDENAGPSRQKNEDRTLENNEITMEGQLAAEKMKEGIRSSKQNLTTPNTQKIKRSRVSDKNAGPPRQENGDRILENNEIEQVPHEQQNGNTAREKTDNGEAVIEVEIHRAEEKMNDGMQNLEQNLTIANNQRVERSRGSDGNARPPRQEHEDRIVENNEMETIEQVPHERQNGRTTEDKTANVEVQNSEQNPTTPTTRGIKRSRASVAKVRMTRKWHLSQIGMENVIMTPRKSRLLDVIQETKAELKDKIDQLRKRKNILKNLDKSKKYKNLLEDISLPVLKNLLSSYLKNGKRKKHGKRWSPQEKITAISIYKRGPRAYSLLTKMLPLPSTRTVLRLLRDIPMNPGINFEVLKNVKICAEKMNPKDKYCILSFDEIALKKRLLYNEVTGDVIGFEDYGNGKRTYKVANHALVFMIQGINQQYKQPIAYFFSEGSTKGPRLKEIINDVIRAVEETGLIVKVLLCDQGKPNQAAISSLTKEKAGQCPGQYFMWDNINGQRHKIYTIFDFPHLMKCFRNNFLGNFEQWKKKTGEELSKYPGNVIKWGGKFAKYSDIILLSELVNTRRVKDKKFTKAHVFPTNREKMRVKYATQLFSNNIAGKLKLAQNNTIEEQNGFSDTADVISDLNDLWDYVNGPDPKKKKSDSEIQNVTIDSDHIQKWGKYRKLIKAMQFINYDGKVFAPDCQKNFDTSLSALQDLWRELQTLGFKKLILRHINQDPLENTFGSIRQNCGANRNPTCLHFESAMKSVLISRFAMTSPAAGTNCEKDDGYMLTHLDKFFDNDAKITKKSPNNVSHSNNDKNDSSVNNNVQSPLSPPVLHIADFEVNEMEVAESLMDLQKNEMTNNLAGKILKKINSKCQECSQCLIEPDDTNNPLKKPSKKFIEMIATAISHAETIIPSNLHLQNVKNSIMQELMCQTDTVWLTCSTHGGLIAQVILNTITGILIFKECERQNQVFGESESASSNAQKVAQQAGTAK